MVNIAFATVYHIRDLNLQTILIIPYVTITRHSYTSTYTHTHTHTHTRARAHIHIHLHINGHAVNYRRPRTIGNVESSGHATSACRCRKLCDFKSHYRSPSHPLPSYPSALIYTGSVWQVPPHRTELWVTLTLSSQFTIASPRSIATLTTVSPAGCKPCRPQKSSCVYKTREAATCNFWLFILLPVA